MRYCSGCGALNDTDAKFCTSCGRSLTAEREQAEEVVQEAESTAEEVVQEAESAAEEVVQGAENTAEEVVQEAESAAEEVVQEAESTADNVAGEVIESAAETEQHLEDAATQTEETAGDIATQTEETAGDIATQAEEAADDAASDLERDVIAQADSFKEDIAAIPVPAPAFESYYQASEPEDEMSVPVRQEATKDVIHETYQDQPKNGEHTTKGRVFGIIAFVINLEAMIYSFVPFVNVYTLAASILGLIFCRVSKNNTKFRLTNVAKVFGILALIFSIASIVLYTVLMIIGVNALAEDPNVQSFIDDFSYYY